MADFTTDTQLQANAPSSLGAKPSAAESIKNSIAKLSMREKVLIWALVFVAVVLALVFFLILPAQDSLTEAELERTTLYDEETRVRLTLAAVPTNQETLELSQARYEEYLLKYQAPMYPEDIDRMITSLLEEVGFTAMTLTLSPSAVEEVAPYTAQAASWELPHPQVSTSESAEQTGDAGTESATGEASEGTQTEEQVETQTDAQTDANATPESETGSESTGLDEAVTGGDTSSSESQSGLGTTGEAQTYTVYVTVSGYEESYYAFLNRVVPLSWMKIMNSSFTPPPTIYADYAALEQTYTFSIKIYIHSAATVKQP